MDWQFDKPACKIRLLRISVFWPPGMVDSSSFGMFIVPLTMTTGYSLASQTLYPVLMGVAGGTSSHAHQHGKKHLAHKITLDSDWNIW